MNEYEKQNLITEARMLAVAGPALAPILERRKDIAYKKLLGAYRDGKRDFLHLVTELFILQGIEEDIKSKIDALPQLTKTEDKK